MRGNSTFLSLLEENSSLFFTLVAVHVGLNLFGRCYSWIFTHLSYVAFLAGGMVGAYP
jgi:hypothetical protein